MPTPSFLGSVLRSQMPSTRAPAPLVAKVYVLPPEGLRRLECLASTPERSLEAATKRWGLRLFQRDGMRRGVRFPPKVSAPGGGAWDRLLLFETTASTQKAGSWSGCKSLRDLERYSFEEGAMGRQNGERATAEVLVVSMAMTIGAESAAATGPIPVGA